MRANLRQLPLFFCILVAVPSLHAMDFKLGAGLGLGGTGSEPVYTILSAGVEHQAGDFSFSWLLTGDTAGQYPAPFHGPYYGSFSADIAAASVMYTGAPWFVRLGKVPSFDIVNSPYSLFVNGSGLAIPGVAFGYEDEHFLYRQTWMYLNAKSAYLGWKDRSAVQKTYAMKFNHLRFGFQDVSVVSDSILDPLDFLLPAPSFMVQYVTIAKGRPWSQDGTASNKNAIMGFFADYTADGWYAYAQLLVDDIDLNCLVDPAGVQNPWMMAFSLGGHYDTVDRGRFGAYAAAALKYTFQPFGSDSSNFQYSYSVYPANAYWYEGSWYGIDMETSMLGYRNGENDLSFCGTWDGSLRSGLAVLDSIVAHQELEFSVTGSQSPGNPWHELKNFDAFPGYTVGMSTTGFLDDPRLRYRVRLRGSLALPVRDFTFMARYIVGYEWNRMELDTTAADPADIINGQPIWRPGSSSGFVGFLSLSVFYTVSMD